MSQNFWLRSTSTPLRSTRVMPTATLSNMARYCCSVAGRAGAVRAGAAGVRAGRPRRPPCLRSAVFLLLYLAAPLAIAILTRKFTLLLHVDGIRLESAGQRQKSQPGG